MGPDNGLNISDPFSQINYQISFDIKNSIEQDKTTIDLSVLPNQYYDQLELDYLYKTWKSKFTVTTDDLFNNSPVYLLNGNKFTVGKEDNVYDRFIPILGTYKNEGLRNPSMPNDFQVIVSGTNKNLRHWMIGIMLQKTRFKAVNVRTPQQYLSDTGLLTTIDYVKEEKQEIYTGKAKLIIIYNQTNSFFDRDISYGIVRKVSDEFNIYGANHFDIITNYFKMFNEDIADNLNVSRELTSGLSRYSCSLSVLLNSSVKFSESFLVDMPDDYLYFDIGFGIPSGGQFISDRFFPYDSSVYDDVNVVITYRNIGISSPSYMVNSAVANSSAFVGERLDLVIGDYVMNNPSAADSSFVGQYGRLSLGIDYQVPEVNQSNFMQFPLTLEGVNKGADIALGTFNELHIAWQSNREKYWDIYTSTSIDKTLPFRFDTRITNTKSNSLMPSITVSNEGKRLIAWHDNRDKKYAIYSARALGIEVSGDDVCRNNGLINYQSGSISQFTRIAFDFYDSCETGKHFHFMLRFYGDVDFTDLVKTISSESNIVGWQYNGINFSIEGVTGEKTRQVTYLPNIEDGVAGKVLYVKVTPLIQDS